MTSLPLDVHEVLEQEYEAIEGAAYATPAETYGATDIVDPEWAKKICAACGIGGDLLQVLNEIINTGSDLRKVKDSPAMTDGGRRLLEEYRSDDPSAKTMRRRIVDAAFTGAVRSLRDARLDTLYARLHDKEDGEARAALCISGGGIRSATFALGIVQGLASAGVLDKFHYLSTVSGGGYVGSWLSSWARRHPRGITGVQEDLARADTSAESNRRENPKSKIDPEPQPLRHLRDYSNYLSPKLGFLSLDTWTIAALYIRNLLLNLLVLLPVLAGILGLPRLFAWLLYSDTGFSVKMLGVATVAGLFVAFGYIGAARPVRHGRESASWKINSNGSFLLFCGFPLTVAGFGIALFWAKAASSRAYLQEGVPWAIGGAAVMTVWPFLIYYSRFAFASFIERRQSVASGSTLGSFSKFFSEAAATLIAMATAAGIFYLLAVKVFPNPSLNVPDLANLSPIDRINQPLPLSELYICFAVPIILLIFFIQASIFVGVSSYFNEDADREWWGRAGAMLMMIAVLGGAACFISVFGPVLLYRAPIFLGSVGGLSGLAAALLGYSAKTPANDKAKEKEKSGTGAAFSNALLGFAVPLFAIVLLAAISLGTTVLIQLIWYGDKTGTVTKQSQFVSTYVQTTTEGDYQRKDESAKIPLASVEVVRGAEHLRRVHETTPPELWLLFGVVVGAALLSLFIGVNRFSMSGLYRNRLIRAYLGASRFTRDPDRFTGFDENDNLQMYELRPELLWTNSFDDPCAFVEKIAANRTKGVGKQVWDRLGWKLRRKIDAAIDAKPKQRPDTATAAAVIQTVNALMQTIDLESGESDGSPAALLRRNREKLEAFSARKPVARRAPLHVVNTALNLVSGDKLAWQQRMAESFTITPLHCGSLYLGYRDAREYGGADGISLGTAVTISGAAASPNMGYHSSAPLAFILTLLNVRLGSWLGNPGLAGKKTFRRASPRSNLESMFYELTGSTNDRCPWVYLSDGGHFENLGLYEMVLRRCRFIVLSDGGCDPSFTFEDLGNAIRKIRIDLGVPIEIKSQDMYPRPKPGEKLRAGSYVATAKIQYSAIDGKTAKDGTLVYIKPSVYNDDDLPRDIYNYAQQSESFPHESTGDQFFSESQFESYRALGRHVVNVVCRGLAVNAHISSFVRALEARTTAPPAITGEIVEVTTTKGEMQVGQAVGDAVNIRIRPGA